MLHINLTLKEGKMKKNFVLEMLLLVLLCGFVTIGCASTGKSSVSSSSGGSSLVQQPVQETYFVNAEGGDDGNDGLSEVTAFKTLQKAIQSARTGTVKRIVIVGIINSFIDINNSGADEIVITGKQDISRQALLTYSTSNVLSIRGNSRIRLENIGITGGSKRGGIVLTDGVSILTLGKGTNVYGNTSDNIGYGGGVTLIDTRSILIMESDAIITNNRAEFIGGGLLSAGTVIIKGDAQVSNNFAGTNGGAIFSLFNTVTMQDNVLINGNIANGDGGAFYGDFHPSMRDVGGGSLILKGNAIISGNSALNGGCIAISHPHLVGFIKEGGIVYGSDVSPELANKASSNGASVFVAWDSDKRSSNKTLDTKITFDNWGWLYGF
jgi:predicted outer membrane repeat protein